MIGLDTNVLVRYIMHDEAKQSPKATRIIESLDADNPGYITLVPVVDLYWVLTFSYELSDQQVAQAPEAILRTKQFQVERADQVMRALRVFRDGKADFADCLIERSAAGAGCTQTMTFDVKAAKHAGMALKIAEVVAL
ncbi:MAG: type II toxin-antitoxin system VapC family toxin [Rhodoferax sp.]|nr:type II toxin-antitoxin system VapC family toxin [Rhodoferax sp.]MCF8211884.1 type II toxin-antitoxin system VapC family toxin [Rhodoferax sp.]